MNVMTREKQTYQDIGEPKVRFGASVRKRGYFACDRVCLILALVAGLTGGLILPGYSWSQALPDQTAMPLVTNQSWTFTGNLHTPHATVTPRRCWRMVRSWSPGDSLVPLPNLASPTVRNSMTQLQEPGAEPAISTRAVSVTQPLCCPTVRSWSPEDTIVSLPHSLISPIVSSSMTRLPEPGVARTTLTPAVVVTQPLCCPTVKVLVAGGVTNNGVLLDSAELYDPATGMWTLTDSLRTARSLHLATLLPSGQSLGCWWLHQYVSLTFLAARRSMTPLRGAGAAPAISTDPRLTRQHYYPVAKSW